MTMRLTVLGGAAAWPNPGQGCSAYLIQNDAASVLVDCGPDTLLELRAQTDYTTIGAIVISHCHADHMLDLVPYRYGLKYGATRPERRIPLWLPPGGIERLNLLSNALASGGESGEAFWTDVFDVQEYDVSSTLHILDVSFLFRRTQHPVPCYAMRITDSSGRALGYSADSGAIADLGELFEGISVALVEATAISTTDIDQAPQVHLTPGNAGELATACGATTLVVTHLWSERSDEDVLADVATAFSGRVIVAKCGLQIDV